MLLISAISELFAYIVSPIPLLIPIPRTVHANNPCASPNPAKCHCDEMTRCYQLPPLALRPSWAPSSPYPSSLVPLPYPSLVLSPLLCILFNFFVALVPSWGKSGRRPSRVARVDSRWRRGNGSRSCVPRLISFCLPKSGRGWIHRIAGKMAHRHARVCAQSRSWWEFERAMTPCGTPTYENQILA